jgi:Ca2+-binding RTX toxin-like protein
MARCRWYLFEQGFPNSRYLSPGEALFDVIDDFTAGVDFIALENSIFKGIGAENFSMKPAIFRVGKVAKDSNDHIIYDKAKGILYYDKDGTGAVAEVKFAKVDPHLNLHATDFFVI